MCKSIPLYILYFINGLPTILYKKRRNDNIQYTSTGFPPPPFDAVLIGSIELFY